MSSVAHIDQQEDPEQSDSERVVPFSSEEPLPPAAIKALSLAVSKNLPIKAIETQQEQIATLLVEIIRRDHANSDMLAQNVAKAMNGLAKHVDSSIDSKLSKQSKEISENVAKSAEKGAGYAVARAGRKTVIFTAATIAVFSTISVVAIIGFLRWNEMKNLRAANVTLAQENSDLARKREAFAVEAAKQQEILNAKRAEVDSLESRQSELIQQIQGTAEAARTLQSGGQNAAAKMQNLAAQKLIPTGKPNEFFVEVEADAKPFTAKDGKHYIRLK